MAKGQKALNLNAYEEQRIDLRRVMAHGNSTITQTSARKSLVVARLYAATHCNLAKHQLAPDAVVGTSGARQGKEELRMQTVCLVRPEAR